MYIAFLKCHASVRTTVFDPLFLINEQQPSLASNNQIGNQIQAV